MDWRGCDLIEEVPGKMSGVPVIKGTRITPETIVVNRDMDVQEIAYQFTLSLETVKSVLAYWESHQPTFAQ